MNLKTECRPSAARYDDLEIPDFLRRSEPAGRGTQMPPDLADLRTLLAAGHFEEVAAKAIRLYTENPEALLGERADPKTAAWFLGCVDEAAAKRTRLYIEPKGGLTPALARILLDPAVNKDNRPWKRDGLANRMRDLVGGRWEINGSTLGINTNAQLNDGQHRNMAAWLTGITAPMSMLFGLAPSSRLTVDTGEKRSPGDRLHMQGVQNGPALQAIVGRLYPLFEGHQPTHSERDEWYFKHRDQIDVGHSIGYTSIAGTNRTTLAAAATYLIMQGADLNAVEEFFTHLKKGHGLSGSSSVLALRNYIINHGTKTPALKLMKMVVAHYNRARLGKRPGKAVIPDHFEPVEAL
jgi:hypothetical protein